MDINCELSLTNSGVIDLINEKKAAGESITKAEVGEVFDKMSQMVPLKRIGEPEEFGYLVAFLSSEFANYINGTNIPITPIPTERLPSKIHRILIGLYLFNFDMFNLF